MDLQEMAAQLRKPDGEMGHQIAAIMNKGNLLINQLAVEALQLKENDTVLEIGMGNGAFIKDILSVHPSISYYGVDYSPTMVEEARSLNDTLVKEGRVHFFESDVAQLPFDTATFSKIFTVNTIYFWEDASIQIAEINRVLKPGGKLVVGIRTKETMDQMPFTQFGFTKYDLTSLTELIQQQMVILDAFEKREPPYEFNGQTMQLNNAFAVCTKR